MQTCETSPVIRNLQQARTCTCGYSTSSVASWNAHRWSAHGLIHPANAYAGDDNQCRTCLVNFPSRGSVIAHLSHGSGVCLLNCILTQQPLSDAELSLVRSTDSDLSHERRGAGKHKHSGEGNSSRSFGPLWPVFSVEGTRLDVADSIHPFGPRKRKYERADFECLGFEAIVLSCYACSYVLNNSVFLIPQANCTCT